MKTVLQKVKREIAELWSSPGDDPSYTQIFEVLERNEPLFKQQVIEAYEKDMDSNGNLSYESGEEYYNETYNNQT